ncbi:hypothetical protein NZ45_16070 [Clostridium botulinum]|uniref:Abortive infection protein-like C-terminal domain-containing protein n=1 Tax=Clostridium botulinum TaxID=1491 RepID=A0ABD7CI88_CLOBO|nr:hypothetical protein [Clostridium botulinum]KGO12775.1 hypothetical protein NZ45_16070 [Clostridium botulinum]QRI52858.1 hypothetical protein JQS73_15695 [Clostridium botulinum]
MIFNIYSKRVQKESKQKDIYQYNNIPERLRMQVFYIIDSAVGTSSIWDIVRDILLREYGKEFLVKDCFSNAKDECKEFIKNTFVTNEFLDIVEVTFTIINNDVRRLWESNGESIYKMNQEPDSAIEELNHRFKENNFGYEFVDGQIIKIDRKFTHNEIVKPSLNLLYEEGFESANEEFLIAHKYYKEGCSKDNPNEDFKNSIINCNKAFESTMKIICENKKEKVLTYDPKHEAKKLINDLVDAGIIPKHLENNFHGVRNMLKGLRDSLENGLPVIRNKVGHGKGTEEEWISEEFVTYSINLAATNIVLLVDIYKQL